MKILLAVDDSACSEAAARALAIYPPATTEVRVLHVVEWPARLPPCYSFAKGTTAAGAVLDARDHMTADAEALVGRVADSVSREGFTVGTFVLVGNVPAEILKCAVEWEADLIVVGTHGRSGLDRITLGSVAEAVVHRAPCAVETVRSTALPAASTE